MKRDYEVFASDVLVMGGGTAGLWAAIRAKDFAEKVILVEKAKVTRSGVSMFCHIFGAPVPEAIFEPLLKKVVERSGYMADQSWFEIMLEEIGDRTHDMEKFGVIFEKDEKGNLKLDAIRGQTIKWRAIAEGKQLIEAMAQEALRRGVEFVEGVAITDLLTSDGTHPTQGNVTGAVGIRTRGGQFVAFKSKAVVNATGCLTAKLHTQYMDNITGDGYAMAFRAGADIGGMEFAPVFTFSTWNRQFNTGGQGQFQHDGSKLVNRLGEEFLRKYETAAKDRIAFEGDDDFGDLCRAIALETIEGRGPVYFDLRAWSQEKIDKIRKVLPFTMMAFDDAGINVKEQLVETTPACYTYATGCESGIRVNTAGGSTIGGLYAAGAAAMYGKGTGPQPLCCVGGYRAGENAAKWAGEADGAELNFEQVETLREAIFSPLQGKKGITPRQIYDSINKAVAPWESSLFKNEKSIKVVLDHIRRVAEEDLPRVKADDIHELVKANEARNFVQLMELVYMAALERRESRMAHYRDDYPYRDDRNWLKWILLRNCGNGKVQVRTEPVPLGRYAILPEKLGRKPSPIQFKIGKTEEGVGTDKEKRSWKKR